MNTRKHIQSMGTNKLGTMSSLKQLETIADDEVLVIEEQPLYRKQLPPELFGVLVPVEEEAAPIQALDIALAPEAVELED